MSLENYFATLLGCAIGDSLGMSVEGWKKEQIKKYVGKITSPIEPVVVKENGIQIKYDEFGKIKDYTTDLKKGEFTDDTILTLAIAESISERRSLDLEDIARKQLQAYKSQPVVNGKILGGFGYTTEMGFKNLEKGISPLSSGVIGAPGNAPAMKISPVGLYMDATLKYSLGLEVAELIGKTTHLDPRSVASGVVQPHAVYSLLQGISRKNFVDSLYKVCLKHEKPVNEKFKFHQAGSLASRLEWIKDNMNTDPETAFNKLGNSSSSYQSYPFAIFMFQKFWNKPIEGLIETINYGGDCDTTGAIYGALAGANNGLIFPKEWTEVIKQKPRIENLAKNLYKLKV